MQFKETNNELFDSSLTEFIQGVSQFSVKGDKESKLRFAFRIYDMDNDGYISNGELFQVSISNDIIVTVLNCDLS